MASPEPLIRSISDTARWIAHYRAYESERSDAHFRDPFARRLAGDRGSEIAAAMGSDEEGAWPFIARTCIIDDLLRERIGAGADLVVNLAAGLDTRPYRLELPPSLRWIEVDLPALLDDKEAIVGGARPVCALTRVRLDLADRASRIALFERFAREGARIVVLTEGLLSYLTEENVASLAGDISTIAGLCSWITDLVSPAVLDMLNKSASGALFAAAGMPFRFAPRRGPAHFVPMGFRVAEIHTLADKAIALHRLPPQLRALLAPKPDFEAESLWSAVCRFEKALPYNGLRDDGVQAEGACVAAAASVDDEAGAYAERDEQA